MEKKKIFSYVCFCFLINNVYDHLSRSFLHEWFHPNGNFKENFEYTLFLWVGLEYGRQLGI
jgi:hypothetical protein